MPADYRLIGATTRQPEEIPPAVPKRSTGKIWTKKLAEGGA